MCVGTFRIDIATIQCHIEPPACQYKWVFFSHVKTHYKCLEVTIWGVAANACDRNVKLKINSAH